MAQKKTPIAEDGISSDSAWRLFLTASGSLVSMIPFMVSTLVLPFQPSKRNLLGGGRTATNSNALSF